MIEPLLSPPKISVVISARNEFPNIVHTVHSIINDLETFLTRDEWEIILVDNGSDDEMSWRFLSERGLYNTRNLKIIHDPVMGNVSARHKGALVAQGKYLFFSDAHMSYKIGSFASMLGVIDKVGGIVHPSVQWMGGYEPAQPSLQYTLKIGEKLWGTWNNYIPQGVSKTHFFIPVSGHCCLGMLREEYFAFGGYNKYFRCYGGGELYLDLKWWMMGSNVSVDMNAVGYHLSAGRGYSYYQDDLIHNIMLMGLALRADALAERVYINYIFKSGVNRQVIQRLWNQAQSEAQEDRDTLHLKHTMYDVIANKPWDIKNDALHNSHASATLVYHDTWLREMSPEARAYYDASSLQRELEQWIHTHMKDSIYQGS